MPRKVLKANSSSVGRDSVALVVTIGERRLFWPTPGKECRWLENTKISLPRA